MFNLFKKKPKHIVNGEFFDTSSLRISANVSFLFNLIPMTLTIELKENTFVLTRTDTNESCTFAVGYNPKSKQPQIAWEISPEEVQIDLRVATDVVVKMAITAMIESVGFDPTLLPEFK